MRWSFNRWSAMVVAALVVLVASVSARAQAGPDVYLTFRLNNWTLAPAIQAHTVKGFLAFADAGAVSGSNISVIWYQREATGEWTTWAWPAYDLADATLYVRGLLSDNNIFEDEPTLSVAAWGTPTGDPVKQVINGLFFDDPVQPLVAYSNQPADLVTALVEIGWEAAPDLSPLAVTDLVVCEPGQAPKDPVKALMDELVYKAETRLYGSSTEQLKCLALGCPGCERIYEGKTPVAGSTWVFHNRILRADNSYVCYYDRDARQYWHEEGLSYVFCNTCSGSGYISTTMHTSTTSPIGDPNCHPPL